MKTPLNNVLYVALDKGLSPCDVQKRVANCLNKEAHVIEGFLQTKPTPPIKGNISLGKIKWRGIIFIVLLKDGITSMWLQQRGEIITPVIEYLDESGSLI